MCNEDKLVLAGTSEEICDGDWLSCGADAALTLT
jgi:hypothetical protein